MFCFFYHARLAEMLVSSNVILKGLQIPEGGKAQLEAQSAASTTSGTAEVSLHFNFVFWNIAEVKLRTRQGSHDQVFCTIFFHQCFVSYHTWTQFFCSASRQAEMSGFFSKQIAEDITRIFFSVKAITQLLRNFFEICRCNSNTRIMCFVDSLFLVYQNDTSTFTKAKSC